MYLELLRQCLTRYQLGERQAPRPLPAELPDEMAPVVANALAAAGLEVVASAPVDPAVRAVGVDWPVDAETMVGVARLDNLAWCIGRVLADGVPGDLIETGVWRGGATILMRAALKAMGDTDRQVWVADSFAGLPKPDGERYPADAGDEHWTKTELAVPVEAVQANFARYGLLDERVRFLVGWFADTLPAAPIEALAVLRLDGDMYGSTIEALDVLYPKLSPGGFCIVDDYGAVPGCRSAVDDYRAAHGIDAPITWVDWTGVWWRKGPTSI